MTLARLNRPATQRVSTPSRSTARLLQWPDLPPGLELTATLAPLHADHVRLSAEFRTARVALEAAEKSRKAAATADRNAYAAALRTGGKDPGNMETAALEKEIAATRRKAEALLTARDAVSGEVERLLEAHEAEFAAEAGQQIAIHRGRTMAALDALDGAVEALQRAKGVRGWLARPSRGGIVPRPFVAAIRNAAGEPLTADALLAGLRSWLTGEQGAAATGYLDEQYAAKHPVEAD